MFKTLDDLKKGFYFFILDQKNVKDEKKNQKNTNSYTGGTSSGLAVENPEEEGKEGKFSGNYNNILNKAKKYFYDFISAQKSAIKIQKKK